MGREGERERERERRVTTWYKLTGCDRKLIIAKLSSTRQQGEDSL